MVVRTRLIRFEANDGNISFGQPIIKDGVDLDSIARTKTLKAAVVKGDVFADSPTITTSILKVKTLLGPLTTSEAIRCVGLYYMRHIRESGRTPPPHTSMFIKPSECVADHDNVVHVPKLAQDEECDYECDLMSRSLSRSHTPRLTTSRQDHSHRER
jgi:2-keto-4-pentenoate hydratase/2-oxohepta-3-ene-1,7-dioic acid hydratase in catechol pathway